MPDNCAIASNSGHRRNSLVCHENRSLDSIRLVSVVIFFATIVTNGMNRSRGTENAMTTDEVFIALESAHSLATTTISHQKYV